MFRASGLLKSSLRTSCGKIRVSDRLEDYDVIVNPSSRLVDVFMAAHGGNRPDFKRDDIATWKSAWGDDYRSG
ncbi:unnamed protein product [Caenorhabditis sp. 36 PRJEB53466]|nr:unnamed protein product [Caenorhabditis sp. 36 PRJEB53466]